MVKKDQLCAIALKKRNFESLTQNGFHETAFGGNVLQY